MLKLVIKRKPLTTEMGEPDDDFYVECSDDENYGFTKNEITGEWEPSAEDIIDLYGKLERKEKIELEWKCPGRRPPTPEVKEDHSTQEKVEDTSKEEEKQEPTEFDFDDIMDDANPITPRRTPGSVKAPQSKKRVARLDKIMDDIFRHKKINQQEKAQTAGISSARSGSIIESSSGNTVHRLSPRGSPRASPRGSPKPSGVGVLPETPLRDSPKGKMSPKKL